ncbi:MAG: NAD-dependent epimerase/dehydratase family protein, partial [Bacteroidia bacterium]|nr:NAD-dependent epimerase/dehydratase family protein [Bacteroidia bacterium]
MYTKEFHTKDLSSFSFLVTGGAGFIGSNIVQYLLTHHAGKVTVLDNLSEGQYRNIEPWIDLPNFSYIQGDITDFAICLKATENVDFVIHQGALGSVPRSIKYPLATNAANVTGFLNILEASRKNQVKRMVYASSSSVYGDSELLPKTEEIIGKPISPYAVSKLVNEQYAAIYHRTYGFEIIGLRYF